MKMFNWVQNKLSGRHVSKKQDLVSSANRYSIQQAPCKEEFIDWHQGLLAIGTIGNNNLKDLVTKTTNLEENPSLSKNGSQDLATEEVAKLQNEFNLLLHEHVGSRQTSTAQSEAHLSVDDFHNYSSPGAEKRSKEGYKYNCDDSNNDGHVQRYKSVAFCREKDISVDNTKTALSKKSLSFLVKKMIACRGGFATDRSLRDPVSESRMGKMLRVLHKKIYPQSTSSTTLSTKKYLGNRGQTPNKSSAKDKEDELNAKAESGSKWVKTDSEYIVLEI